MNVYKDRSTLSAQHQVKFPWTNFLQNIFLIFATQTCHGPPATKLEIIIIYIISYLC